MKIYISISSLTKNLFLLKSPKVQKDLEEAWKADNQWIGRKPSLSELQQKYETTDNSLAILQFLEDSIKTNDIKDPNMQWILNLYKNRLFFVHDVARVQMALRNFAKYRNRLNEKDLLKYKTLSSLTDAIDDLLGVQVKDTSGNEDFSEQELRLLKEQKAEIIYHSSDITVVSPTTYEASKIFAREAASHWCTALLYGDSDKHYKIYVKDGPLYIIYDKYSKLKNPLQFHFHSGSFKDSKDVDINLIQYLTRRPIVCKIFSNGLRPRELEKFNVAISRQLTNFVEFSKFFEIIKNNMSKNLDNFCDVCLAAFAKKVTIQDIINSRPELQAYLKARTDNTFILSITPIEGLKSWLAQLEEASWKIKFKPKELSNYIVKYFLKIKTKKKLQELLETVIKYSPEDIVQILDFFAHASYQPKLEKLLDSLDDDFVSKLNEIYDQHA